MRGAKVPAGRVPRAARRLPRVEQPHLAVRFCVAWAHVVRSPSSERSTTYAFQVLVVRLPIRGYLPVPCQLISLTGHRETQLEDPGVPGGRGRARGPSHAVCNNGAIREKKPAGVGCGDSATPVPRLAFLRHLMTLASLRPGFQGEVVAPRPLGPGPVVKPGFVAQQAGDEVRVAGPHADLAIAHD